MGRGLQPALLSIVMLTIHRLFVSPACSAYWNVHCWCFTLSATLFFSQQQGK